MLKISGATVPNLLAQDTRTPRSEITDVHTTWDPTNVLFSYRNQQMHKTAKMFSYRVLFYHTDMFRPSFTIFRLSYSDDTRNVLVITSNALEKSSNIRVS